MRLTSWSLVVALARPLWTPAFRRLAFARRLQSAAKAGGLDAPAAAKVQAAESSFIVQANGALEAPVETVLVRIPQPEWRAADAPADADAAADAAAEDACAEPEKLDADTRRQQCESPWRHDGEWLGIDPQRSWGTEQPLHAYLFTYTLYAGAPGAIAGMLDAATSMAGVQIVHTALVFCQGGDQETRNTAFADWCKTKHGDSPAKCWVNLEQQQSVCGDADCRVDLSELAKLNCKETGFFEGWGVMVDQAPKFDDFGDTAPQAFWLGTVTTSEADKHLQSVISCKGGDFNPGTYDAIGHNCHAFVEAMMGEMKFPVWSESHDGKLPAAMTPEVSEGTGMVSDIASWVGGGDGSWTPSPDCDAPTNPGGDASGGDASGGDPSGGAAGGGSAAPSAES